MSDKEAVQGMIAKIKKAVPRSNNPEPEAPPEIVEQIGASFDREMRIQQIGALAVAEEEERQRQQQQ